MVYEDPSNFTNETIHHGHHEYSPYQIYIWEMEAWGISGGFTFLACLLSLLLIYFHLKNWNNPNQQKYIVRLILMVPIYAIDSWLSIRFKDYGIYFDIIRDCYEAYVIYQFFGLLTVYIESERPGNLFEILEKKDLIKYPLPLCFLKPFKPSLWFLIIAKQCILQYVIIKPIISIIAAILQATEKYNEGSFLPWYGYVYCTSINLFSVTVSMYFLVWFYVITEEELEKYRPISKFLCVKSIIFFSFWQSVIIAILSYFNVIPEVGTWSKENIARGVQDFIICLEMFLVSIAHIFVFDYETYKNNDEKYHSYGVRHITQPVKNFAVDVVNQKDMVKDMKHAYNPKNYREAKKHFKETKKKYHEKLKDDLEGAGEEEEVYISKEDD